MSKIDCEIETVVILDRSTGQTLMVFESPLCSTNTPSELWWEIESSHYVVYEPDDYYDEALRARRNSNNMLSPRDSKIRLVEVGLVYGIGSHDPEQWTELARSKVRPL